MLKLIIVTIIWSFSFSLIGHYIAKDVDTYIAILIRFSLALFVFLPFVDKNFFKSLATVKMMMIGAIQVGLMYICYFNSYKYLNISEIALLTTTTPIYVYSFDALFSKKLSLKALPAILGVILGAWIIKRADVNVQYIIGIALIQAANICFAIGQILYKRFFNDRAVDGRKLFAGFYLGALIVIIPLSLVLSDYTRIPDTLTHYLVLIWLGVFASGIGYYLWNQGGSQVSAAKLSVMNNAVIPLAIFVEFIFWNGDINWAKFIPGLFIMMSAGIYLKMISEKEKL